MSRYQRHVQCNFCCKFKAILLPAVAPQGSDAVALRVYIVWFRIALHFLVRGCFKSSFAAQDGPLSTARHFAQLPLPLNNNAASHQRSRHISRRRAAGHFDTEADRTRRLGFKSTWRWHQLAQRGALHYHARPARRTRVAAACEASGEKDPLRGMFSPEASGRKDPQSHLSEPEPLGQKAVLPQAPEADASAWKGQLPGAPDHEVEASSRRNALREAFAPEMPVQNDASPRLRPCPRALLEQEQGLSQPEPWQTGKRGQGNNRGVHERNASAYGKCSIASGAASGTPGHKNLKSLGNKSCEPALADAGNTADLCMLSMRGAQVFRKSYGTDSVSSADRTAAQTLDCCKDLTPGRFSVETESKTDCAVGQAAGRVGEGHSRHLHVDLDDILETEGHIGKASR
jgi:hypothetical protein